MEVLFQAWKLLGRWKYLMALIFLVAALRRAEAGSDQERAKLNVCEAAIDRTDPNTAEYFDAWTALQEQEAKSQSIMAPLLKDVVKRTGEFESEAISHEGE